MLFCITAILLYYVFTLFHLSHVFMYVFRLFFPFLIALFIHFLLDPIIDYFESDRLKRKIVVIHIYIYLTILVFLVVYFIAPYVCNECISLYQDYTKGKFIIHPFIQTIIDFLDSQGATHYLLGILNGWTQSLFYWCSNIALGVGISFYLSYDNMHLIEKAINYIPFQNQSIYRKYLKKMKLVTFSFIKSLFLDFFFFFLLCLIPFYFLDSSYFIWIALFISMTNLIPYIGPYIGGIPIIIYEYMITPTSGYIALAIIIVLQYLESSFLQPYLFQKCISVHPIALFFSLSVFGDLFGVIGMIFSPLFLVYSLDIIELLKEIHFIDKMKKLVYKI